MSDRERKLIATLALVLFVIIWTKACPANGEEPTPESYAYGEFVRSTKDFEVDNIGDVEVTQSKVHETKWTLNSIDYYSAILESRMNIALDEANKCRTELEKLRYIRPKVEAEAKKSKLKNISDKNL